MASDQLDALLTDLRARLEALYGERLEQLILYGSHARGDAAEESDVDVLTVLSGDVRQAEEIFRTSQLAFAVGMKHDVLVSVYAASAQAFREKSYGFSRNVRAEGIPV